MSKCAGLSIRVSPSHPYNANMAGLGWMRERQCVLYMQWWCCVLVIGKVWRIVRFPNRKEISFVRLAQFSFQKEKIATAHILVSMWYHALMQPLGKVVIKTASFRSYSQLICKACPA